MKYLLLSICLTSLLAGCQQAVDWHSKQHPDSSPPSHSISLPHPEARGWYTHYADPEREYLGIILEDLGPYRDQELPQPYLDHLSGKLSRQQPYSIILRFAYDYSSAGQDAPLAQVLAHLEQLGPVLTEHREAILVLQAGFVGAWGEWHSSSHGLEQHADRIVDALLKSFPGYIQLRTPGLRHQLLGHWSSPVADRVGLHNDCTLASESDFGTYPYIRDHWRHYPSVFRGGETCKVSAYTTCENALKELRRQKFVYLNKQYHQGVLLQQWKDEGCYDEIGSQLGRWD